MRIVYCLNSISETGGIAAATIAKANALAEIPGNEVIVCVSDFRENALSKRLSPKVNLIDLKIAYYADDWKSKWHVIKGIVVKRKRHKRKLKDTLHSLKPDMVISVGQSEKYFLPAIKGDWKVIREVHFASNYRVLMARGVFGKLKAKLENFYDFKWKIKGYDRVVVLTGGDKENFWRGNRKVEVIPNPITFTGSETATLESKKIITIGRLEYPKNVMGLVRAFREVNKKHPDWQLEIYGEGGDKDEILKYLAEYNLKDVVLLKGVTSDPAAVLAQSAIFALPSLFEGFGLVLIEAMECGVPVVSYDCPSGPRDIITDGEDGFLVPTGDETAMAERICHLIEHTEQRKRMGAAAARKAKEYAPENIAAKWMRLFADISNKRSPAP